MKMIAPLNEMKVIAPYPMTHLTSMQGHACVIISSDIDWTTPAWYHGQLNPIPYPIPIPSYTLPDTRTISPLTLPITIMTI